MRKNITIGAALCLALIAASIGTAFSQAAPQSAPPRPAFTLTSPAFADGTVLPDKYSVVNTGKNISPPLSWVNAPATAQSFVLILHDVDVTLQKGPGDELHWFAFNIPATAKGLPEGLPNNAALPDGMVQPNNGGGLGTPFPGFMAPGAPAGKYHHYVFELYALDTKLALGANATRDQVLAAIGGHVVGKAALTALFHR
jgi:Raf kinase inhibitor-like YbhB/YbcL family protein